MQHHFAILGGTTYDHIVHLPQFPGPLPQTIHHADFHEGVGSTGAGKALAMTRLHMPNTLYALTGNDEYGSKIRKAMEAAGVNTIWDIDPAGTERHINIMNEEGGRISIFATASSEHPQMQKAAIREMLNRSTAVIINIIAYCKELVPMVREAGVPVWTDLHDYNDQNPYHEPFIQVADYIQLSSDNLPNYRDVMQRFISQGKKLVVCTHGKQGSTALTANGEWFEQAACKVDQLVDTNGAGDCYFGGFLWAFTEGFSIQECMQLGSVAGALATRTKEIVPGDFNNEVLIREWKAWQT